MIPIIKATRLRFQGFVEQAACNVSPEPNTAVWGDSGIHYLQQLSESIYMEANANIGILYYKIGATITDNVQLMVVDAEFKVIKSVAITTASSGQSNLLFTYVNR